MYTFGLLSFFFSHWSSRLFHSAFLWNHKSFILLYVHLHIHITLLLLYYINTHISLISLHYSGRWRLLSTKYPQWARPMLIWFFAASVALSVCQHMCSFMYCMHTYHTYVVNIFMFRLHFLAHWPKRVAYLLTTKHILPQQRQRHSINSIPQKWSSKSLWYVFNYGHNPNMHACPHQCFPLSFSFSFASTIVWVWMLYLPLRLDTSIHALALFLSRSHMNITGENYI